MPAARLVLVSVALLATLATASPAAQSVAGAAPKGLHGFLLRPNEPVTHTFPRTPAFAWAPVRGAACYEFELATSRTFEESSLVWTNVSTDAHSGKHCRPVKMTFPKAAEAPTEGGDADASGDSSQVTSRIAPIKIPAVSLNLVLPWFTGRPYALYAHVRAVTSRGASRWSNPFGFNMRWEDTPIPQAGKPGLVRWAPVEGATAYDVWYPDDFVNKVVRTHTNVVDQRDLYTFHLEDGWWRTVNWRVRAVRQVVGSLPNGLPAVSYGPWTSVYSTTNPPWSSGPLKVSFAVSDRVSSSGNAGPHQLMPGLTFTGDRGLDGREYRLFRVYAATDRDCVNVVFKGSVVGSPAFAPRASGPLALPVSQDELDTALVSVLPSGKDEKAKTFTLDTYEVVSNEVVLDGDAARIDLPDLDAKTTRYYWTVVPVGIRIDDGGALTYWDVELPQDACQAGRVATFGKQSQPAITTSGSPFVSGLSPNGRLLSQAGDRPVVYSSPLVAWRPVVGAMQYEVQWSRTKYPWRKRGSLKTFATSAVLKMAPGVWYYRIRGLNGAQVGTPAMTWSRSVAVKVARPVFQIARG